jgi:small subunit ribosomal protein S6e
LALDQDQDWAKLVDRRLAQEFDGDLLKPEWKGHTFKITGGSDKNGFAMKQGVLTKTKLKLLLRKGTSGYRQRREGVALRKSVRGCIIGQDLAAINLVLVKKGDSEIPKLTDATVPRRLGPKRANKIRKLFSMDKHSDNIGVKNPVKKNVYRFDVTKAVVKRVTKTVGGKTFYKAPKIQRLITSERIYRKKQRREAKYTKAKAATLKVAEFNKRQDAKANKK